METLQNKILSILDKHKIGPMATLRGDKPYGRYMTFRNEKFILYTTTEEHSQKMDYLETNPYVHILLGYTNDDNEAPYIEYTGKLTEIKDDEIKLKVTNFFRSLFNSDKDDLITLQIEPVHIKYFPRVDGKGIDLPF